MAGRTSSKRIKRTKLFREIMESSPRVPRVQDHVEEAEFQGLNDLPTELLEKILSQLKLRDNIRASSVCRRWNTVATSVRVADKAPWVMFPPNSRHKSKDIYQFYDPSLRQRHFIEFPELRGSRIAYSKDSWLLMYKRKTKDLFFFCLYTRELIELPKLAILSEDQIVVFSTSPKRPGCIIFTIQNVTPTELSISTCRPEATQWTTINYQTIHPFKTNITKIIFCKNLFYCLSVDGSVGVYNPEIDSWNVLSVSPPRFSLENLRERTGVWLNDKFLAEKNGHIYFIHTFGEHPVVFRLDLTNEVWVEMESLDGMTFFVSVLCSHVRTDLLGQMRNSMFFPKIRFYGRRCVSYCFNKRRYFPLNRTWDWRRLHPYWYIWIDAPEDLSLFL